MNPSPVRRGARRDRDRRPSAPLVVTELRPTRGWVALGLRDVWEYRELLGFLAMRDIKVRYKQTVLGAAWAILQPVATAVDLRARLRPAGQAPLRRRALPRVRPGRAGPVDLLRHRRGQHRGQPDRQHQPGQQGLLPAALHPHRDGARQLRRPAGLGRRAAPGAWPSTASTAGGGCSRWCPSPSWPSARRWASGCGSPRSTAQYRDVRHVRAVPAAVLALRHPGRLREQPAARAAGTSSTRSTRWWAWSRASAGRCWAAT